MPTVAVLMSTYNGEKYIREQLDSIFLQEGVEIKLFVRDDGSTDGTVDILREYARKYPVKIIVDGENVGPGESFMRLVYQFAKEPGIEYYAFADQDDIWFKEKLEVAVEKIKDVGAPALYSSNQYIYINGENRGVRHKELQSIELIPHMTKNTISGCTFVFNKELAQLVADAEKPDRCIIKYRLHDSWMILIAIVCGRVIYDENAYMLYRIHALNTVGIKDISARKRLDRLRRFFIKTDDANLRMITAREILRLFPDINDENQAVLRLYADYQKSWKSKREMLRNKEILDNSLENRMIFAMKILLNFI